VTLANERVSLSSGGVLWGAGPSWHDLLGLIRDNGGSADPVLRQRIAALHAEATVLDLNRKRSLTARLQGRTPGPEASIQKLMADEHGQRVVALAADLVGAHAMIEGAGPAGELPSSSRSGPTENRLDARTYPDVDPVWSYAQLFAPALTIGGGTFAVQRNIVAELVLGLPREPDVERGLTWSETRQQRVR
jgi:alkylation response protein AidB-like acyl-CoA dehydrogenase